MLYLVQLESINLGIYKNKKIYNVNIPIGTGLLKFIGPYLVIVKSWLPHSQNSFLTHNKKVAHVVFLHKPKNLQI